MAYKKAVPSTVYILSSRGAPKYSSGTGSVIDRGRRLILTNYHVVLDVKQATVFFPRYVDNKLVSDPQFYMARAAQLGVTGEVVALNKAADLALIRVQKVPDGVKALVLARDSAEPGQSVHSIGNPALSGALWVYTPGKVRQVYSKKWSADVDGKLTDFQAQIVETDSATNAGDSGGPLVNDRGELVGVTEGYTTKAHSLSTFVDISEVRKLLHRSSVVALPSDEPATIEKPARAHPLKSTDGAKIFGKEAWRKAVAATQRLYAHGKFDLLIETVEPPEEEAEKIKAMTNPEKGKYFRALSNNRVAAEKLSGIHILVYMSPKRVYVRETSDVVSSFPQGFVTKIRDALTTAFRESRYDEGLETALEMILDAWVLAEKK